MCIICEQKIVSSTHITTTWNHKVSWSHTSHNLLHVSHPYVGVWEPGSDGGEGGDGGDGECMDEAGDGNN